MRAKPWEDGELTYDEVVKTRRSIRGFLPRPIERSTIEEIIELAMRAPSSHNTQSWNFYVVAGAPLDAIRRGNTERNVAGVPHSCEFRMPSAITEGIHRERQIEVAKQLFEAMGIARDDVHARQDWILRGFRQFDAPVSVVITYDRALGDSDIAPFDCGAVANALVNAAWSRGIGCVINSQGIMQSPIVREHAQIAGDQIIMICVAMGYPDHRFPANSVISRRKTLTEAAHFIGWD